MDYFTDMILNMIVTDDYLDGNDENDENGNSISSKIPIFSDYALDEPIIPFKNINEDIYNNISEIEMDLNKFYGNHHDTNISMKNDNKNNNQHYYNKNISLKNHIQNIPNINQSCSLPLPQMETSFLIENVITNIDTSREDGHIMIDIYDENSNNIKMKEEKMNISFDEKKSKKNIKKIRKILISNPETESFGHNINACEVVHVIESILGKFLNHYLHINTLHFFDIMWQFL